MISQGNYESAEGVGPGHTPQDERTASNGARPEPHPLDPLRAALHELTTYLGYYITVQTDRLMLGTKQTLMSAGLGVLAGVTGAAALVVAVVQILYGISEGIAILLGGRVWAGNLITGVVVIGATLIAVRLVISRMTGESRRQRMEKYERIQDQQRAELGIDVAQRAAVERSIQ
ncbi:MAG TPA: hypothetical protein VHB77_08580 [Planctomycetaceae bacterium]|nr:hypothetical protein [Planctomycetaceae bacterium]